MKTPGIFLAALVLFCGDAALGQAPLEQSRVSRSESRWHGDWQIGTPRSHGLETTELSRIADEIGTLPGVYSFLLVSGGELLVERYYRQGSREKPHNLKSASKSIISILTGIAIDKGYIRLDQPISELLAEARNVHPDKGAITVGQLLSMTSGLETTSYGGYNRWIASENWVKSALEVPLVAEPGTFYQYSTGNTHLLSAIIAAAAGTTTLEFANRYLFEPMNIEIDDWQVDPQGLHIGGNNMLMTPRDMAKIGLLVLDGGRWDDRQLVSTRWVQRSTQPSRLGEHDVYGTHSNLWWTDIDSGDFAAVGFGGQYIYVSPAADCIIVITSTLYSKGEDWTARLFDVLRRDLLQRTDTPDIRFAAGDEETEPSTETLALRRAVARARDELAEIVRQLGAEVAGPPRFETTTRVNFRSGPSQSAALLGLLEPGVPVDVKAKKGKWFEVTVGGRPGWLYADYVGPAAIAPDLGPEIDSLRRALADTESVPVETAAPAATLEPTLAATSIEPESARAARLRLADELAQQRETTSRVSQQLDKAQARVSELEQSLRATRSGADGQAELQAESASLRESVSRLQESLARRENTISEISQAMASAADRIAELRLEAQSREEALRRALAEKQVIESTLEQERRKIALLQDALETTEIRLGTAETDLAASRSTVATLRADAEINEQSRQQLSIEKQTIESVLEQGRRQVRQLQDALDVLNKEFIGSQAELDAVQTAAAKQREALTTQLQSKDEILAQAVAGRLANEKTLEQERRQTASLQRELDTSQTRLGVLETEWAETQAATAARLAALQSEIQSRDEVLAQAMNGRQALETTLEQERRRAASLQRELDTSQTRLGVLETELAETQAATTARLAALQSEIQSRDEVLAQAVTGRQALETTLEQERSRIASLQRELDTSQNRLGVLETELAETQAATTARLAALQSEIQSRDEVLAQAATGRQALERTLEQERRRTASLQRELDTSHNRLGVLETELAETQAATTARLAALQSEIQSKDEVLAQAVTGRQAVETTLEQERSRIASLQRELDTSQNRLGVLETELAETQAATTARLAALQSEIQSKDEVLAQAVTGRQAVETTLEQERSRIASLQRELDTSQTRLGMLETELAETQAATTARLAALQSEIQSKDEVLAQAVTGRQAVETTLEQERSRIASLQRELDTSQNQLGSVRRELVAATDAGNARIAAIQADAEKNAMMLEQAERDRQSLQTALEQDRQEIGSLEGALAQVSAGLTRSQTDLRAAREGRSAAAAQAEQLAGEIMDLQQQFAGQARSASASESERARLADRLRDAEAGKKSLQGQLGLAQSEVGELEDALVESQRIAEQLIAARAESDSLRESLSASQNALETETARREAESMRAENAQMESAAVLAGLQSELAAKTADLERAIAANDAVERSLGQERARTASLEESLADARGREESTRITLTGQLDQITAKLGASREALQQANIEKAEAAAELARLTGQAEVSSAALTRAEKALSEQRQANDAARRRVSDLETAIDTGRRESESRAATASAALAGAQARGAALRDSLEALTAQRDELASDLDQAQDNADVSANRVGELETAMARLQGRVDAKQNELTVLGGQRVVLADQLSEATADAMRQRAELDRMASELTNLQAELADTRTRNTALQDRLAESRRETAGLRTALEQSRSAADQRLATLTSQDSQLRQQLDDARNDIAELQLSIERNQQVASERDDALAEVVALDNSVDALRETLSDREAELADNAQVIAGYEAAAGRAGAQTLELTKQLTRQRSESARMAKTLDRAQADKAAADDSLLQAQRQIAVLEESLLQATRRAAATRSDLGGQIEGLGAELELSRALQQQANRDKDDSIAELARLRQRIASADGRAPGAPVGSINRTEPTAVVSAESTRTAVVQTVMRWAEAWSSQDTASYLAAYADDFVPSGNLTLATWRNQRRARVSAPRFIEVSISDLAVEATGSDAVATFTQAYRSNTYSDLTEKELALRLTANGWKIIRERAK